MSINRLVWEKLGLIFSPNTSFWWSRSHAQLPTPLALGGGVFRIFYSSRTETESSHVGWIDVDLNAGVRVIGQSYEPILVPGPRGNFDADGVYLASVVPTEGGRIRGYTVGWQKGVPRPMFYASIGVTEGYDFGVVQEKVGVAPIMAQSEFDPCLVTSPVVIREKDCWRMWYVSGFEWTETPAGLQSHYDIKHAISLDGLSWSRDGHVCLAAKGAETNISRFWVLPRRDGYWAWYGYNRGQGYRIGFAISKDGLAWQRHDEKGGVDCSDVGWDSAAVSYPAVVAYDGKLFMFYNGNAFGKDGIGLAVAVDPEGLFEGRL